LWLRGFPEPDALWRAPQARRGLRGGIQLQAERYASQVPDGPRCELQDAIRGAIQDGLRGGTQEPDAIRAALRDGFPTRGGIQAARRGETPALRGFQGEPERHEFRSELSPDEFQFWEPYGIQAWNEIQDVRWIATPVRCGSQAELRRKCGL
jgi:hypothetical protein